MVLSELVVGSGEQDKIECIFDGKSQLGNTFDDVFHISFVQSMNYSFLRPDGTNGDVWNLSKPVFSSRTRTLVAKALKVVIMSVTLKRMSRRKRGMASNPLFIIPDFFCIFQTNLAMATLGLKEMGKLLWEGREKSIRLVLLN